MEKASIVSCEGIASLPQDILIELLLRMPVKSLLRLKSVSKSYYSLITSEYFIKAHLQYSTKNTPFSSRRIGTRNTRYLATLPVASLCSGSSDDGYAWDVITPPPPYDPVQKCNVPLTPILDVGCCNGLFCFLSRSKSFVLCNPSTRVFKTLPYHDMNIIGQYNVIACGFGWEEVSDEYKLVVFFSDGVAYRTVVYRSKKNYFSNETLDYEMHINPPPRDYVKITWFIRVGELVSGKLYWLNWSVEGKKQWPKDIVWWELKSERFGVIEVPSSSRKYDDDEQHKLGVIGGCLSYVCHDCWWEKVIGIWVMKEEIWQKHVNVSLCHGIRFMDSPMSLRSFKTEKGEIVLFSDGYVYVPSLVMPI